VKFDYLEGRQCTESMSIYQLWLLDGYVLDGLLVRKEIKTPGNTGHCVCNMFSIGSEINIYGETKIKQMKQNMNICQPG
jgi:hypothetical protein